MEKTLIAITNQLAKNADFSSLSFFAIGNTKDNNGLIFESCNSLNMTELGSHNHRLATAVFKYAREDSNLQPSDSKSATLSN